MSAILGVGACTPIGLRADSAAAAYYSDIPNIQIHPRFIDAGGQRVSMAFVDAIERPREADRMAMLATAAVRDLLAQPGVGGQEADLLLALPAYRPGFDHEDARGFTAKIRDCLGSAIALGEVVMCQHDQAGGVVTLAMAMDRNAPGRGRHCVVVAADSYVGADTLDWIEADQRLKTEENPFGLIPGEAAAAMLLGPPATRPGTPSIVGSGLVRETADAAPGPYLGRALSGALLGATDALASRQVPVKHLFVDLNGEIWRTDSFGNALVRASPRFALEESFNILANRVGETGAAYGVLAAVFAVIGRRIGMLDGRHACICGSSSRSGARAAVVLDLGEGTSPWV